MRGTNRASFSGPNPHGRRIRQFTPCDLMSGPKTPMKAQRMNSSSVRCSVGKKPPMSLSGKKIPDICMFSSQTVWVCIISQLLQKSPWLQPAAYLCIPGNAVRFRM